ncbi:MAG: FAD-dependent oxidoreductase [Acidimicrobiia bacterium]
MKPIPSIDLVGAGITGLMIAWFINQADPNIDIVIYDAQPDPRKSLRSKDNSPTFGGDPLANCIRQITGTEGLVLPRADAMHFEALPGNPFVDKLGIAPDNGQNVRRDTFVQIDGAMNYFEPVYDVEKNSLHSQINYASLELWLALSNANLSKFLFSCKTVDIFHINKENFDADLLTEEQLYWHGTNSETISSSNTGQPFFLRSVYDNHLVLPGASVDSRSFALALLNELSRKENVTINFNRRISKIKNTQGLVILANNGVHRNIGQQRLTSLGGYWASVDNTKLGITKPFKLALDPPIGYVNVTPNSNGRLSISGGLNQIGYFGAMGDAMLQAGKQAFLDAIKEYFDIDEIQRMGIDDISGCLRPYSDNGLSTFKFKENLVDITGAGKAGTTQLPLISMAILQHLGFDVEAVFAKSWGDIKDLTLYNTAISTIFNYGLEPIGL